MDNENKRRSLWHRMQRAVNLRSILVCPYCENAYVLRFELGAAREHCSAIPCRVEHARNSDERNRQQSRARARVMAQLRRGIA